MGKLDDLRSKMGGSAAASMRIDDKADAAPAGPGLGRSAKMVGVDRSKNGAWRIALGRIVPDPDQPRRTFEPGEIEGLGKSLREEGQETPIRVRWIEEAGHYMIQNGERRYRAAKHEGLESLEAVIDERGLSPERIFELQLVDNCVRADIRPLELAGSIRKLIDRGKTQEQVAHLLKMPQAHISKFLALLGLPEEVRAEIDAGAIPTFTGYYLSRLEPGSIGPVAEQVKAGSLSASDVAKMAQQSPGRKPARAKGRGGKAAPQKKAPKSWAFKSAAGLNVSIESRKGIEPDALVACLREALAVAEGQARPAQSAAA